MGTERWVVLEKLRETYADMRKNLLLLPMPVLFDLLFLFVNGFVTSLFMNTMMDKIYRIGAVLMQDKETPNIYLSSPGLLNLITRTPETSALFREFLLWTLMLAAVTFLIYCIFQSASWKFCLGIADAKSATGRMRYLDFLKKFAFVSTPWYIIYCLYVVLSRANDFSNSIAQLDYINEPASKFGIILSVILMIMIYLAGVSYCMIGRKRPIIETFKRLIDYKHLVPAYIIIGAGFFLIDLLLSKAYIISPKLMVLLGMIIALPAMSFARIYLKKVVDT